uniref:Uncharacterized protein n=1 Tax=Ditylenchus dipsaci TaxID=166011 RepID=A0A915CZT1_9BILA
MRNYFFILKLFLVFIILHLDWTNAEDSGPVSYEEIVPELTKRLKRSNNKHSTEKAHSVNNDKWSNLFKKHFANKHKSKHGDLPLETASHRSHNHPREHHHKKRTGFYQQKNPLEHTLVHVFGVGNTDWISGIKGLNKIRRKLGDFTALTWDKKLQKKASKALHKGTHIYSATLRKPEKSNKANLVKGIQQMIYRMLLHHLKCKQNGSCRGRQSSRTLPLALLDSKASSVGCVARLIKKQDLRILMQTEAGQIKNLV